MVTVLVEKWGNSTGPNEYAQFQTYAALGYSEKDGVKGYHIYKRCYVVVSTGNTGFQGTIAHTNWSNDFRMNLSGTYVDSDWVDDGWVSPGSTYSVEGVAYYDSDNGARYTSTASASYTASSKTVTYDANGGTGAPKSQTTLADAEVTLSSTKPARTGYTFKGWATSKTATTANYQPGGSYTANATTTLYAVWQQNCLTVNYYSNYATSSFSGALNAVGADKNVIVRTSNFYYATAYTDGLHNYTASSNGTYLARTGYTATGDWGTTTSGGKLVSQDLDFTSGQALAQALGKTLESSNQTVNVYAQWKINTYKISYNKNTTDTVENMPDNQTKTYGKTLALSSNIPTRAGYGFQGWATSANGKVAYVSGANYTANNGATLYAVWKADTYVVSYNSNAGDDAVIVPGNQFKEHNVPLTLSSDIPTRKQYKFKYWTNAQGTIQYHPGDTYSLNESITLYAVWELTASKVTIYDSNGSPHSYLCYVYDESGMAHYAIVSIYDAQGVPHNVT
jgi:uncharacterized repeat protein (TIGR02543 family)